MAQIVFGIGHECFVTSQFCEVGDAARIGRGRLVAQKGLKPEPGDLVGMAIFMMKQCQLREERDIGKRQSVADKERAICRECRLDPEELG